MDDYTEDAQWLLLGCAAWFPANAIADELPALVHLTGENTAGYVTAAFQMGNLPLLFLKPMFINLSDYFLNLAVSLSLGVGLVSLVLMIGVTKGDFNTETGDGRPWLVVVASVLAGGAGAVACCCLWSLTTTAKSKNATKNLSIGMAVSCVVSGILILAQHAGRNPIFTTKVYFTAAASLHVLCTALSAIKLISVGPASVETKQERLIEENTSEDLTNDPDELDVLPVDATSSDRRLHIIFGFLYAFNYYAPSFLPFVFFLSQNWAYRAVILSCNAGDLLGRIFLVPHVLQWSLTVLYFWLCTCVMCTVFAYYPEFTASWLPGNAVAVLPVIFFVVTYARGSLITKIQMYIKDTSVNSRQSSAVAGMYGQLGGVMGALLSLPIVVSIKSLSAFNTTNP